MKKLLRIFCLIVINLIFIQASLATDEDENSYIRKGTFLKAIIREEVSTLTADIEDEVVFINTQDMYVYETNGIPEGTIIYGEVEDVREPVQGLNGSIKISINKLVTPDKKVYKVQGHVYTSNDNYIGGEPTQKIYYHKVPHYIKGFRPMLQVAPLNVYEQGEHVIIKPGQEFMIIIDEDVKLK